MLLGCFPSTFPNGLWFLKLFNLYHCCRKSLLDIDTKTQAPMATLEKQIHENTEFHFSVESIRRHQLRMHLGGILQMLRTLPWLWDHCWVPSLLQL